MNKDATYSQRLLPGVHSLRGLAAISVVLFHLHHLTQLPLPQPLYFVGAYFGLGVQLFFVLSAFSLFYSTSASLDRQRWVLDYFIKRFFRIAPLFYFMALAWGILFAFRGYFVDVYTWLLNCLLIFNFIPGKHESIVQAGWTIGVEVIFYVLLPVLLLTVRKLRDAVILALFAALISTVVREQLEMGGDLLKKYSYFSFMSSLGSFALGILAYKTFEHASTRDARTKYYVICVCYIVASIALIANVTGTTVSLPSAPITLIWCLVFASITVAQALKPLPIARSHRVLQAGELSYSIYLLHPMIIFFMGNVNKESYNKLAIFIGPWAFIPCAGVTLVVVIFVSILTYRFVEQPAITLGRYLTSTNP